MIRALTAIAALTLTSGAAFGQNDPLSAYLLSRASSSSGICSLPRCGDGKVAIAIAKSGFLVHAMESPDKVEAARKTADGAGILGRSLYVQKGTLAAIPMAENSVDLLVIFDAANADLTDAVRKEILRVLSPCIGRAVVGCAKGAGAAGVLDKAKLEGWAKAPGIENSAVSENEQGLWATFSRPPLEGADDWTHWFHGPDNNPVSADKVFTAPFQLGWISRPFNDATRAVGGRVAARGRVFVISESSTDVDYNGDNTSLRPAELIVRNAYNGQILWKREISKNVRALSSTIIAAGDFVYLADGTSVFCLDAATGKETGKIDFGTSNLFVKWLGLSDGILVMLGGPEDPPQDHKRSFLFLIQPQAKLVQEKKLGFGTVLAGHDLAGKKAAWKLDEPSPIDCRTVGMLDGKVFFYAPGARLGCINLRDGKLLWSNNNPDTLKLIDEPIQASINPVGLAHRPSMICVKDVVYLGLVEKKNFLAVSAKDGNVLWSIPGSRKEEGMNYLCIDGKINLSPYPPRGVAMVDALTGKVITTKNNEVFLGGGCGTSTASVNFVCAQAGGIWYDLINKKRMPFQPLKTQCYIGTYITQGMYYCLPHICTCSTYVRGFIAQAPMKASSPEAGVATAERLETGPDYQTVAPLKTNLQDWPTGRGTNKRTGSTTVAVPDKPRQLWAYDLQTPYPPKKMPAVLGSIETEYWPTSPVAAGGLFFYGGTDGRMTCLDVKDGKPRWTFFAGGPVLASPTVWEGRVLFGSADGYVYALEATTGRLLWKFRAAPVERNIMIYGLLQNSWPVNSGVLVDNGVAYFAAGMVLQPRAFVFALDAATGKVKWENSETTCIPSGFMALWKDKLWVRAFNGGSGGAAFDIKTGKEEPRLKTGGMRGVDIGILKDRFVIYGGGNLYKDLDRKYGSRGCASAFLEFDPAGNAVLPDTLGFESEFVSPAWNDDSIVFAETKRGVGFGLNPRCWNVDKAMDFFDKASRAVDISKFQDWQLGQLPSTDRPKAPDFDVAMRNWGPLQMEINSIALAGNAVVMTWAPIERGRAGPAVKQWKIGLYKLADGSTTWEGPLPSEPARDSLCIDRDGNICVTLRNGGAACFGK
ncbi:MAG: PQQ-binding-like beta-propeller repeat protein [Planctomycetes bacterium]|nr:PQQ-binding-like beta-propeller repeat protein [Planctomycetota bacterium]